MMCINELKETNLWWFILLCW